MNLAVVEGDVYSFYNSGEHVISVASKNMSPYDLEYYRQNLDVLVEDARLAALAALADEHIPEQLELDF